MKKNTIRVNESQLRRIVKESVKRVLNEGFAAYTGGPEYDGSDLDYERVKEEILDVLYRMNKEGKQPFSYKDVARETSYRLDSFNAQDMATFRNALHDACNEYGLHFY